MTTTPLTPGKTYRVESPCKGVLEGRLLMTNHSFATFDTKGKFVTVLIVGTRFTEVGRG